MNHFNKLFLHRKYIVNFYIINKRIEIIENFKIFISYPFDWRTPLGYVACVSIQAVQLITLAEIYVSGIMFTIGVCMQISNFASDIKEKLDQFNRIIISSESELTIDDQTILRKRLNEIIEFHAEARE